LPVLQDEGQEDMSRADIKKLKQTLVRLEARSRMKEEHLVNHLPGDHTKQIERAKIVLRNAISVMESAERKQ
jgi:hypothetical protein